MRTSLWALLLAVALSLAVSAAQAAPPALQTDGWFHWTHPGADPYTGTLGHALELFAREGVSREALQELKREVDAGKYSITPIREQEHYDYMLAGKGKVERHVVAETRVWSVGVSRAMRTYMVVHAGMVYELGLPDPCKNWTLRIRGFNTQEWCIP